MARRSLPGRLVVGTLGLLFASSSAMAAEDAERPPLHLQLDACVPVQVTVVRQTLAVEVGALYKQVEQPAGRVTRVSVHCADAQIWLRVEDPRTGRALLRQLDLWMVDPSVRARLLGLSIAELIDMIWTELRGDASSSQSSAETLEETASALALPVQAAPNSRRVTADPTRGGRLLGVAAVSGFFKGRAMFVGGGLRLGFVHGRHLGWVGDLLGQHADVVTPLGTVSIDMFSTSIALLFDRRWSRLALHLGGGFRGGVGSLAGHPLRPELTRGSSFVGLWGGPLGVASLSVRLQRRLVIEAQLDGGYALFSLSGRVSGLPLVGMEGPWLGGQVGIGLLP